MEDLRFKEVVTTCDFEMSVGVVSVITKSSEGMREAPDEIGFLISGYSSQSDIDIEEIITISKRDAKILICELSKIV